MPAKGHPSGGRGGWKLPTAPWQRHPTPPSSYSSPCPKCPTKRSPLNVFFICCARRNISPDLFFHTSQQKPPSSRRSIPSSPSISVESNQKAIGCFQPSTTAELPHLLQLRKLWNNEMHLKNANTRSQKVTPDERLDRTPPPEGRQLALRLAADSEKSCYVYV